MKSAQMTEEQLILFEKLKRLNAKIEDADSVTNKLKDIKSTTCDCLCKVTDMGWQEGAEIICDICPLDYL